MISLRKLISPEKLKKYHSLFYSTKKFNEKSLGILSEVTRNVHPFSSINIEAKIPIQIKPYDLLDCPDSNILRARIHGSDSSASTDLHVDVIDKNVTIKESTNAVGTFCVLEVPVKSNLKVNSESTVNIKEMYSDYLKVETSNDVNTKNLRCTTIDLASNGGHIFCDGLVLAHKIDIHTESDGNVMLDKLQGDMIHCKTFGGNIQTNSCYVENSKFVTETGNLYLKNLHKTAEVYVLKKGNVDVSGFHGNLYMKTNGGNLNLQFSEINGDNIIMAENSNEVIINISEDIERSAFVEISSDKIILDNSLLYLSKCLSNNCLFRLGEEENHSNKLLICSKGSLTLGKMSWADRMKQIIGINDN